MSWQNKVWLLYCSRPDYWLMFVLCVTFSALTPTATMASLCNKPISLFLSGSFQAQTEERAEAEMADPG